MKLLHSEFLNIWGKLDFLFYQCLAMATSSTSMEPLSTSHAAISQMKFPALHQQILPEAQRGRPAAVPGPPKRPSDHHHQDCMLHCKENPIYVFLFWELRGLSPNFDIHVSLSDIYIPRIGPHISCSIIGRSIMGIYKSLTDTWMWKLGLWLRNSFSGNICFQFSVLVLWEDLQQ